MQRAMEHNTSPISLREGELFLNGKPVLDTVSAKINIETETWSGRQLGERKTSTRMLGYKITGEITRYFTNNWTEEIVKTFQKEGRTMEFTLIGKVADPGSDYYVNHGATTITVVGCVLTGTIPLLQADSNGEVRTDTLSFNAADFDIS